MELSTAIGVIFTQIKNYLPTFIMKKMYSADDLKKLVYVDIRSRHDSVSLNLSQPASVQVWLQIINLSPFDITLDRSEFNLYCGHRITLGTNLAKPIKPGEIIYQFIESQIQDSAISQIAFNLKSGGPCTLNGNLQFKSALYPLDKGVSLDGIFPKYFNIPLEKNA